MIVHLPALQQSVPLPNAQEGATRPDDLPYGMVDDHPAKPDAQFRV